MRVIQRAAQQQPVIAALPAGEIEAVVVTACQPKVVVLRMEIAPDRLGMPEIKRRPRDGNHLAGRDKSRVTAQVGFRIQPQHLIQYIAGGKAAQLK